MKSILRFVCLSIVFLGCSAPVFSQGVSFFFSAGDLTGTPDRFGNTHTITPTSAVDPRPFGNEALQDVFFDEDNLWLIYQVDGNIFLVSHGPGFFENAPEIAMNITAAIGGRYEVILNFMDDNATAGLGPIQAALGDAPLQMYDGNNSTRATGGTTPGYPQFGGITAGSMFWYSVILGEVTVANGGQVKVRVDDVQGDTLPSLPPQNVTTTFQGVTLRALELTGTLPEIQVSPGALQLTTDFGGNQFRTWPMDEAAFPTQDDWLTTPPAARVDGSGKWHMRNGLGPYGPILESFPVNANDAMPLRTSVKFVNAGTFDVYMSIGDTGASTAADNDANPNPLQFNREGAEATVRLPNDGEFKGTPGYNNYEIFIEKITVSAGETVNYIVDDVQGYPNGQRSVYLGMRFVLDTVSTDLQNWALY